MPNKKEIFKKLKKVIDPELGINIVDLGLIYDVKIKGEGKVEILMTLTTPGCPLAGVIENLVKKTLIGMKGIKRIDTRITFDPPWTQEMMSQDAKQKLGFV